MAFKLCAFESSLVLPLEAATNDLIALLEELNDRLSQVLPAQLQRHAAAEGLDIDAVMRSAAGDLCVCEICTGRRVAQPVRREQLA